MPAVVFAPETGISRERLQAAFATENADARVFFWPLSGLPSFEPVVSNVFARTIPTRAINLPSYHDITENDLIRVVKVIRNCFYD
jgi:perosamine synthetase